MSHGDATAGSAGSTARRFWSGAVAAGVLAFAVFAFRLSAEPSFVDEWAYYSQAYYARLFASGDADRAAWLDYPAYDLPPLPKYLVGLALWVHGDPWPGPSDAQAWYSNTSSQCATHEALTAARWPTVILGALGCAAIYGLGTLAYDHRAGALASLLLMFNPLYRMLARRAMSDVMAESMILCAAVAALWAWKQLLAGRSDRTAWLASIGAGVCCGLAALAKLNGALASIIIVTWAALALGMPRIPWKRKGQFALAGAAAGITALATFTVLNPFLTARPPRPLPGLQTAMTRMSIGERLMLLVRHRMAVSAHQQQIFPHNAVKTPAEKLEVIAVQGYGRFGAFGPRHSDSRIRYDRAQDWGAVVWIPWVTIGAFVLIGAGRRQLGAGSPPTAWAVLAQAVVASVVVAAYLPLAWDRYFLSLQAGSALLASAAAVAAFDALKRFVPGSLKGRVP